MNDASWDVHVTTQRNLRTSLCVLRDRPTGDPTVGGLARTDAAPGRKSGRPEP